MPDFLITAPDGRQFRVKGQGSREDALAALQQKLSTAEPDAPASQDGNFLDPVMQGLTFGFSDEIAGGVGGAIEALRGGSFGEGYTQTRDRARGDVAGFRERNPKGAVALEIAGALPTAVLPMGAVARGATLGNRVYQGAKTGAIAGGVYGVGAADGDLSDRFAGGVKGTVAGGLTGGTLPLVTRGVGAIAKPVKDAVKARINPAGYAAQKVTERLGNQGMTVGQAASRIGRARQAGQPMALMDVGGDSLRDLARTTTNVPGPARNRLTASANLAAMSQGDRIKATVGRVVADPDSYQDVKEQIIQARATAARPHYELAYSRPVPYTRDLEAMLNTPAGRSGLAAARQNTLNRREPWAQWFANIADDGTIIDARRVPDTRALDEVKRVLDRMVEEARAVPDGSPFARPRNTPRSIAIQSVRDDLVAFLDRENPSYRRARRVALDNIQADEALEFGRNALTMDSRILAQRMSGQGPRALTEGQQELARVGMAEALRKKVDDAGLTHNALLRIFSTREQGARLRPFFRSEADWRQFRQFMFNEARKRKSYDAIRGNSTTARQLLDAQEAGQLGEMGQTVAQAARGGIISATIGVLERGIRRLGGLTPQTASEMARLLATRDPQRVRGIVRQLQRVEASRASSEQKLAITRQLLTGVIGGQEGRLLAAPSSPQ